MKIYFLTVIAVLMTLVHTGCTVTGVNYFNDQPVGSIAASKIDLRKIRTGSGDRTPVILIHGLWGSELREKNSKDLRAWGDFSCYPPTAEARFKSMALNFRHKTSAQDLLASDILRTTRVNFMGMNFDLENYSRIIALLEALGYVPEKSPLPENSHYCTLFIYHYDWRKSIDENALN